VCAHTTRRASDGTSLLPRFGGFFFPGSVHIRLLASKARQRLNAHEQHPLQLLGSASLLGRATSTINPPSDGFSMGAGRGVLLHTAPQATP